MRVELLMSGRILHGCEVEEIRGELSIGRSSACNWAVPKDQIKVSSRHAVLFREKDTVVFKDLESTNGSFLLGQRVARHVLRAGDEIHFGDCQLRLAGAAPAGAAAAGHPRLRIRSGPLVGQAHVLNKPEMVIGSDASADISIRDPMLSKRHALLSRGPDGSWTIKDLGSTNGTTVGGVKVEGGEPRALARDGRFYLAHHGFVVEAAGAGRKKTVLIGGGIGLALLAAAAVAFPLLRGGSGGRGDAPRPSRAGTVVLEGATPDFAKALAAARASHPESVAALESLQVGHGGWRSALMLLAGEDFTGFDAGVKDLSFSTNGLPASLSAWIGEREKERLAAADFRARVQPLLPRSAALGKPVWEDPRVVKNLLAADALDRAPAPGETAPEAGDYGLWLGSQTTFKRLFTAAGKLSLEKLSDSPRPALADEWRECLREAAALLPLANSFGLPPGPLRSRLEALDAARARRDTFLQNLLTDAAQAPGRAGLLEAELAARLADKPAALRVGTKPLEAWLLERFTAVLQETETLKKELDAAAGPERAAARKRLLQAGLPGDPLVNRVWAESAGP